MMAEFADGSRSLADYRCSQAKEPTVRAVPEDVWRGKHPETCERSYQVC